MSRALKCLFAVGMFTAAGTNAAEPVSDAEPGLSAKLPPGLVKTVLERLTPKQRAAIEAAATYEVGLAEQGYSAAPPTDETDRQIENLVGARMALLVAANAFEDNPQALAAYNVTSADELRTQAMATEVAKTKTGRRFLGVEGFEAVQELLSVTQMIVKPWKPCGEGTISDALRIPSCVARQSYRSVVGLAWQRNGQWEISCSGQLISARFVLTADHCFDDKSGNPAILTHFTGGTSRAVRKGSAEVIDNVSEHAVLHVRRGTTTAAPSGWRGFDVALVELADPVPFTGFPVIAGAFPNPPKLTAAGWGRTDAKLVNQVALEVTSISVRGAHNVRTVDPSLRAWSAVLKDGGSICAGDSGGPIFAGMPGSDITSMQLVGLVAAGNHNCTSGDQVMTDLTRAETVKFMCELAPGNPYCRPK